jgi:hypothetical protein
MGKAEETTAFPTLDTGGGWRVYKSLAGGCATLFVVVVYRRLLFEGDIRIDAGPRLCGSSFVGTFVCCFCPVVKTVHLLAGETFEREEIEDVAVFHLAVGANSFDIALVHLGVARWLLVF